MLKDTKSLGNNKAPACESRGFVHKKGDVHFDTPPLSNIPGTAYFAVSSIVFAGFSIPSLVARSSIRWIRASRSG